MTEPRIRALSLGAGVQSTTLALMAAKREVEPPDCAIFADTGWEPARTYAHLAWLEPQLPFPVYRVSAGNIREDVFRSHSARSGSFASIPWFLRAPNGDEGIGRRQCTNHYKLEPIARQLRALLGYVPRQRIPAGAAEIWLGISVDEAHRMRPARMPWMTNRWPLIDAKMSRRDCRSWLDRNGYPQPPKSACIGCPFHSNEAWAEMRDQTPDEFADAVAADRIIRTSRAAKGEQFMHPTRVPLDRADFRRPEGQADMFGNDCDGMCGV